MDNNKALKLTTFDDLLEIMKKDIRLATAVSVSIIPLILALRVFFNITFQPGLLVTVFLFTTAFLLYYYLLAKNITSLLQLENMSLSYFCVIVILYTLVIHYLGGVEGIGIIIYLFPIVASNIILPLKKKLVVVFAAIFSFSTMVFLEYYSIISHYEFFFSGPKTYDNLNYVIFAVVLGAVFGFNYLGAIAGNFSSVYRKVSKALEKERKELFQIQDNLKDSRDTLEVRVKAKTDQFQELTEHLEEEVAQRAKELGEKVKELEKFQRFAVAREMEMIDLKSKIKKLEESKD